MRTRIPLNDSWFFTPEFDDAFLKGTKPGVPVELPHTCVQTPFHYFDESIYQMLAGYRRVIHIPDNWTGKRVFVRFGAAAHRAVVYANGNEICTHANGYTAFEVELTPFVTPGKDLTLTLSCDSRENLDQPPFGFVIDYMTYGGLYREVTLEVREQDHIAELFVIPTIPEGAAEIKREDDAETIAAVSFSGKVEARIDCTGADHDSVLLRVHDAGGKVLSEKLCRADGALEIEVPRAHLWDVTGAALYELEAVLLSNGAELDAKRARFGFRRAEFRADGFYLNGRKLRIVGLNRHQSYPYVGYAMPASQQRFDADILKKELGVNAVRTSHYPQSPHFIDRCDELGLLVFTEIPGWQHIGGQAWKEQAVKNVEEMVVQYRNHPSIILWGVRINESRDDDSLYTRTNETAHRLDPTRQTGGVRYLRKSHLLEDVYTFNDFTHNGSNKGCEKRSKVTPDMNKGYLITEYNGHMFPTKPYDCEDHRLEHALRHAAVLDAVARQQDIAGSFGWCMFDYNTHKDFGSGDRICYHGVTDMFRNPKMAAAVYAAARNDAPFLEISGSMDVGEHPGGMRGRIFAFTNADSVRVYKNGVFIREYAHKDSSYKYMNRPPIEIYDLIGELIRGENFPKGKEKLIIGILNTYVRACGKNLPPAFYAKVLWAKLRYRMKVSDAFALYDKYMGSWGSTSPVYRFDAIKNRNVVATVEKTPMKKLHLEVLPDRMSVSFGETYEVVSTRLRVCDERGNTLPFYAGEARVAIEGPLTALGPDSFPIIGGMGGGYLRTTGKEGRARVVFKLPDAEETTVEFDVRKV